MRERPILFSTPMVRALRAGTKTQTRRIVKPQPPAEATSAGVISSSTKSHGDWWWMSGDPQDSDTWIPVGDEFRCPYGVPGDTLWVREHWASLIGYDDYAPRDITPGSPIWFQADHERELESMPPEVGKWRVGMFLPRWASRLTLTITEVRVERLQEISEADAIAEGVGPNWIGDLAGWSAEAHGYYDYSKPVGWDGEGAVLLTARESYATLWESINGPGSWDANVWVWVLTFRVEK